MKGLKKDIEYNFDLDVFLDPWNRLWIQHNDINIGIEKIAEYISITANSISDYKISDHIFCNDEESILYCLMKYCKDVHKWGDFNNLN